MPPPPMTDFGGTTGLFGTGGGFGLGVSIRMFGGGAFVSGTLADTGGPRGLGCASRLTPLRKPAAAAASGS